MLVTNMLNSQLDLVVFIIYDATFNIFHIYCGDQFYWWRKPEYLEKTTDLPATLSHNVVHLALSRIRTHNFSGDRQ